MDPTMKYDGTEMACCLEFTQWFIATILPAAVAVKFEMSTIRQSFECQECGQTSAGKQAIDTVVIAGSTCRRTSLFDLLDEAFKKTAFEQGERPKCDANLGGLGAEEKCQAPRDDSYMDGRTICMPPQVLIVGVKQLTTDITTTHISFPQALTTTPWHDQQHFIGGVRNEYVLHSVISCEAEHYTIDLRGGLGLNTWYNISDGTVVKIGPVLPERKFATMLAYVSLPMYPAGVPTCVLDERKHR
jgi:hypothetical protein